MSACSICTADNQEELEHLGLLAQSGDISWRESARRAGLTHHAALKRHMEAHYVDNVVREAQDELEAEIAEACTELRLAAKAAPPEVRPLYFAAIRNLQALSETKPSQQHLIQALKAITEMTGMKNEQRLMLQFAQHFFQELPSQAAKALPPAQVVDVEEVLGEE